MSILIMLVLLSILILVHEFGHFITARMFGIKVEKFGFGLPIGPTLFQKKIGDVTILVHAFLLGGYVSFPDDEKDCELDKDSPDRFLNKPIYQRAVVVSAGVIFNVICAFLIVYLAAFHWGYMPAGKYDVYVNDIVAEKSAPIWKSGMQKGDRIVSLNNTKVTNTNSLLTIVNLSKTNDDFYNQTLANKYLIQLKEINFVFTEDEVIPKGVTVKLPDRELEPAIGLQKEEEVGIVKPVNNDEKLNEIQVKVRDSLTNDKYITGNEQFTLRDLSKAMADNSHPLYFVVDRNGKHIALKPFTTDKKGKIGVQLESKEVLIKTQGIKSILK